MFLLNKKQIKIINFIVIVFLFFSIPLFPQLLLRGVAPLSPENYFKYVISMDGLHLDDSISYKVLDSVVTLNSQQYYAIKVNNPISSGYIFCGFSSDSFYVRYDTLGQDSIYKYLKYGADVGDTWTQNWYTSTLYFSVTDSYPVFIWGNIYAAKEIHLTDYGLISMYFLWTDSVGLVSEFSEGQYIASLVGCVINGQLYGDTTMYVTSVKEIEQPIQEFILMQNYPNPFNAQTNITYQIPTGSDVNIKIYNVLGEEITALVDDFQNAGRYTVSFNANNLSSGLYTNR